MPVNVSAATWDHRGAWAWPVLSLPLRTLHALLAFPSLLYVAALGAFLLRPPDLNWLPVDRIAFGVLCACVALRVMADRQRIPFIAGITLPMLGLITLAVLRAAREPFDITTWSIAASKFVVPFAMFHLALLVFRDEPAQRHLKIFVAVALAYLVFIAIAFLVGARGLIFPRFILDPGLGIQATRARGPLLQAVANGLSLNLLGLLTWVFFRGKHLVMAVLCVCLPLSILATMTRAVWIAFVISVLAVGLRLGYLNWRRALVVLVFGAALVAGIVGAGNESFLQTLSDRTSERGPVNARMAVYEAGWQMFLERPVSGWTAGNQFFELARRMRGYHLRAYYVHNTYLSLLVEYGAPGLALYVVLFWNLFRLARSQTVGSPVGVLADLRRIWPVMLGVFLFNAIFVDMAYQFVNSLLFTVAAVLIATPESQS